MRRLVARLLVVGLVLTGGVAGIVATGVANADEHVLPEHPHLMLFDPQVDFSGDFPVLLSLRKCVDLAANQALRLNAHHQNVHFGQANVGLQNGGKVVIPAAPFPDVPWSDCAGLLDFYDLD